MDSATIDETNTRAICDEIGERLKMLLKSTPDEQAALDGKLHQLLSAQELGRPDQR